MIAWNLLADRMNKGLMMTCYEYLTRRVDDADDLTSQPINDSHDGGMGVPWELLTRRELHKGQASGWADLRLSDVSHLANGRWSWC
jgi:hypothetical protein